MRWASYLTAAFAILTIAVAAHALRPLDRFGIDHLQPFSTDDVAGTIAPALPQRALRPILEGDRSPAEAAGAIAFAPADSISALVLAAAAAWILLLRRRPWWVAGAWIGAVLVGLGVEGMGKLIIPQIQFSPPSTTFGVTLHNTYPSGHSMRAVIVAAMVTALWPRLRPFAIVWVGYVTAVLELGGLHVLSDIAGGLLVGGALACAALAVQSGGHAPLQASGPPDLHPATGAPDGRSGRPRADRGQKQPEAR
jgi:membrane-associated phospholipid phosphatase